jgi:probable FeS assembly SUF system protein SufT
MSAGEVIKLKRDCEAVQIPSGQRTVLPADTEVTITQSLGGAFTVVTDRGYMVRIAGKDADAIGQQAESGAQAPSASAGGAEDVERAVWDQLRTCYDPEIPVNIADLGLIYSCFLTPLPEGGNHVEIKMTLTAPGCGMGEFLKADVENKILGLPGVKSAAVELVWDPPWDRSMMSEAAKLELGMI